MLRTTSRSTASGASIPKAAGLPRLSLRMWCQSASSCLARRSTGPRMSYRTFCSLLACDTMRSAPRRQVAYRARRWRGRARNKRGARSLPRPAGFPAIAGNVDGRVGMPGKQVLEADLHPDHRPAEALFTAVGLRELPGPLLVSPAGPGRARPGDPEGADEEQDWHEQAEEAGPYLSLEQGDRGKQEEQGEHRDRVGSAWQAQVVRGVVHPDRAGAQQEQRGYPGGDEDGIDGQPSRAGPVHVPQVQHDRELVEDERGAGAEYRGGAAPPAHRVERGGELGHPGRHHEDHAEHHVVNVQVTGRDIAEPPADLGTDEPDRQPDKAETGDKGDEEAEQRQPPGVHDLRREPAVHLAPQGVAGREIAVTTALAARTRSAGATSISCPRRPPLQKIVP